MTNQKQAMLYGLGTVLLWSTVATAFKLSLRELAPVQMLLIACSASVVVMAVILMLQGRWHLVFSLSRKQYAQSFGMGLINPCLYYFLLFGAFDRLPAQEAQPLNYTWALVLAYMSVPFLGHRLRKLDIVAGLICYAGVVVIATRGAVTSLSFEDPLGVSLALGVYTSTPTNETFEVTPSHSYRGSLDHLQLWTSGLTTAQILADYQTLGSATELPTPVPCAASNLVTTIVTS